MFATELKSELERLGLTQAEAASILGVSPRAVWKWLHGQEPLAVTAEGALARLKKCLPRTSQDQLPIGMPMCTRCAMAGNAPLIC